MTRTHDARELLDVDVYKITALIVHITVGSEASDRAQRAVQSDAGRGALRRTNGDAEMKVGFSHGACARSVRFSALIRASHRCGLDRNRKANVPFCSMCANHL